MNFNQGALKLAIDFAGADHILAGSDYPHQIGSIPSMLEAIRHSCRSPTTERAGIAGRQRRPAPAPEPELTWVTCAKGL